MIKLFEEDLLHVMCLFDFVKSWEEIANVDRSDHHDTDQLMYASCTWARFG
jgi:hypothetical protein